MSAATNVRTTGSTVVATFPGPWLRVEHGAPKRLAQVVADHPRAALVVNGPMFDSGARPRFLLLDRASGLRTPSSEPDEGVTIWTDGGRAHGAYGGHAPDAATAAVQGWPSLVVDGRVTASDTGTNAERVWRPGIGVTADGRVMVVALVGTMTALAERMRAEGAVFAGYLDGGSSTQLEAGGVTRESPGVAPVPTWILAEPPSGTSPWLWVGGGACALALLYVGWQATRAARGEVAAAPALRSNPPTLYRTARGRPGTPGSFWTPSLDYTRMIHPTWRVYEARLAPDAVVARYEGSPSAELLAEAAARGVQVAVFPIWDWDGDEYVVLDPSALRGVAALDGRPVTSPSRRASRSRA